MEEYKIKKVSEGSFIKRNKRSFIKLICTSLIAYSLVRMIDANELNAYRISNALNNNYIENVVQDYIHTVEGSAVPGALIAVGNLGYGQDYKFINRVLYDEYGKVVDLTDDSRYLYFTGANIDKESLELMNLKKSNTPAIVLSSSSVTNDCISSLPSSLLLLSLNRCNYLTDLSELPKYCPDLQILNLDNTNLDNFDFVYELPDLKILNASESLNVTKELLSYLNENNIETNITKTDVELRDKLIELKNSIITDDMSEKEKVQAICLYVIDHMQYDINLMDDSNANPLELALFEEKGVCISYAYLTDALLKLEGIETYKIDNMTHAWNLLKLDGNYYYIDTTNMDFSSDLRYQIFKEYSLDGSYLFDPTIYSFDSSTTIIDSNLTIIPTSLKEEILSLSTNNKKYNYSIDSEMFNLMLFRLLIKIVVSLQACNCVKDVYKNRKKLVLTDI